MICCPNAQIIWRRRPFVCRAAFFAFSILAAPTAIQGQEAADSPPDWWYPAPPGIDDPFAGPFEIEFDLGFGFQADGNSVSASQATEEISPGLLLDQLISRIFVYRRIHDRLILDFDYDASRGGGSLFEGEDFFALEYVGETGELVRRASLGNRMVSIPGDRYIETAAPPGASFAAVVDAQTSVAGGVLSARGIARVGNSELVTLNFVGHRRIFDLTVQDIDHIRRKHFFFPDIGIDDGSLAVYRSSSSVGDIEMDGRSFTRLQSPQDFTFDRSRSWLHLSTGLFKSDLIVTYTSANIRIGDPILGQSALIDGNGNRDDFSAITYPEQFGVSAGTRYLYLNRDGENSYWEHRGVYFFEELSQISEVDLVQVDLLLTGLLEFNSNYSDVITNHILDPERGLLFFLPEDSVGFYPRPFPGLFPFTHPTTPGNPFDIGNSVYGNLISADERDSVNTLRFRFSQQFTSFTIDEFFIHDSVTVNVSGRELEPGEYSVDESTGVITVADGIVSPETSVTVRYRKAGDQATPPSLLTALSADWVRGGLTAHGMVAIDAPFRKPVAPMLGREQPVQGTGSAELTYHRGVDTGSNLSVSLWGGARIGDPNAHDAALIAGMDSGNERSISLQATAWQLASDSSLLPGSPASLSLIRRGELVFEDFFDDSLIGGGLQTLAWDNSENRSFGYGEKAGPYSSADAAPDGAPPSLVLDYRFDGGEENQFVTIARPVAGGLNRYDALEISYRADGIAGASVRLYVEILQTYNEDLDADGVLDGEGSIDDTGFTITPAGGASTVIGSDRSGESNGVLDSEDLNGNGRLDPVGGGGDLGRLIPGPSGPFVAEVAPGGEEWREVRLDLRSLIAAAPEVFEDADAIRLTLVPSATPVTSSSGRIVINRLVFRSSGMVASSDGRLALRILTPETSPDLVVNPLSAAVGEAYDDIHGSAAYRDTEGVPERVLELSLIPPLPSGERTSVSTSLGGRTDLTRYEFIVFYLFAADPAFLPAELLFDIRFLSTPGDYLSVSIDPTALLPGWNELRVETAGEVSVNGTSIGMLSGVGENASMAGVTGIELGITAVGGDLVDSVILWTDDWHARGSRLGTHLSGGVSARASYDGDLLTLGSLPLVTDPRIAAEYEYDEVGIVPGSDEGRHTAGVDGAMRLAGIFPLGVSGRWSSDRLRFGSLSFGETTFNLNATAGIDLRVKGVPKLEHSFRYASTVTPGFVLSGLDYLEAEYGTAEASIRLSEEFALAPGWAQHLSGIRTVTRRSESYSSGTMSDAVSGTLAGRGPDPTDWSMTAAATLSRSFLGTTSDILGSPPSAYTGLITGLFEPATSTLTDAALAALSQRASLKLTPARDSTVGLGLTISESTAERNFNADSSVRDLAAGGSVSVSLPLAIGRERRVRIVPSLGRSLSTSVGQATLGHSGKTLLVPIAVRALAAPFTYLTPISAAGRLRERDAVTTLVGLFDLASDSGAALSTEIGLEVRIDSEAWFIPSALAVRAEGETQVQSSAVSQQRSIFAQLSRSMPIVLAERGVGSLVISSSGSFTRDFLLDTETFRPSLSVYYAYSSVTGRSWQINQNTSWTRERQHIAAERLSIFPDDPLSEPDPSFRADSDRLVNRSTFQYSWRADRAPSATPSALARRLGVNGEAKLVINREQISVETSTTFADPLSLGITTLLPLRITLEHSSEVTQTENLSFRLSFVGQGGLEKHVSGGYVDLVPAFGFELRLTIAIRY